MSVLEPDEPNDDDILAALDFTPGDTDDVVDVTALNDVQLVDLLQDTREKLLEMGEMLSDLENTFGTAPASAEARELHNLRAACLTEMTRRGLR